MQTRKGQSKDCPFYLDFIVIEKKEDPETSSG